MMCQKPGCDGDLEVTHCYDVGVGKTQSLVCPLCGRRYTAVTFVRESVERGDGAFATAMRMRKKYPLQPQDGPADGKGGGEGGR